MIPILTLGLGFIAYKRFLVQQVSSKQVELVLDLIEKIHKTDISVWYEDRSKKDMRLTHFCANLFRIANGERWDKNLDLYLPADYFQYSPWQFLHSPILPNNIAAAIKSFHSNLAPDVSKIPTGECFVIGDKLEGKESGLIEFHHFATDLARSKSNLLSVSEIFNVKPLP